MRIFDVMIQAFVKMQEPGLYNWFNHHGNDSGRTREFDQTFGEYILSYQLGFTERGVSIRKNIDPESKHGDFRIIGYIHQFAHSVEVSAEFDIRQTHYNTFFCTMTSTDEHKEPVLIVRPDNPNDKMMSTVFLDWHNDEELFQYSTLHPITFELRDTVFDVHKKFHSYNFNNVQVGLHIDDCKLEDFTDVILPGDDIL